MSIVQGLRSPCRGGLLHNVECGPSAADKLGFVNLNVVGLCRSRKSLLKPIMAKDDHDAALVDDGSPKYQGLSLNKPNCFKPNKTKREFDSSLTNRSAEFFVRDYRLSKMSRFSFFNRSNTIHSSSSEPSQKPYNHLLDRSSSLSRFYGLVESVKSTGSSIRERMVKKLCNLFESRK